MVAKSSVTQFTQLLLSERADCDIDFNGRPGNSLAECHTLTFPRDHLIYHGGPVYIFQTGVTACICHVRVVRRHVLM